MSLKDDTTATKPWAWLRMSRKKYDTLKPWKNAGMSKEEFERILLRIPSERIEEMYDEIHADKLVAAAFKLNPGDLG